MAGSPQFNRQPNGEVDLIGGFASQRRCARPQYRRKGHLRGSAASRADRPATEFRLPQPAFKPGPFVTLSLDKSPEP